MEESWSRSCAHTSLRSVCTYDLGQDSPIQTSCSINKSYVFQSYSRSSGSSAPRVTIGCVSIVVAFFLLVTGGVLVTVFEHKNEQKGKNFIYQCLFFVKIHSNLKINDYWQPYPICMHASIDGLGWKFLVRIVSFIIESVLQCFFI